MNPLFKPVAVALFGTCGESEWRKDFINCLENRGVPYFNPQLQPGQWKPDAAELYVQAELHYFESAPVVVFAITKETLSSISLMEVGFSIYHVLTNRMAGRKQTLLLYVDENCIAENTSELALRESIKTRKMLLQKLQEVCKRNPEIQTFDSLDALRVALLELMKLQP